MLTENQQVREILKQYKNTEIIKDEFLNKFLIESAEAKEPLVEILERHPNYDPSTKRIVVEVVEELNFFQDYAAGYKIRNFVHDTLSEFFNSETIHYSSFFRTYFTNSAIINDYLQSVVLLIVSLKLFYIKAEEEEKRNAINISKGDESVEIDYKRLFFRNFSNSCFHISTLINIGFNYTNRPRFTKPLKKLLLHFKFDLLPNFEKMLANISDFFTQSTVTTYHCLSINPVDFFGMGKGNSWLTCYRPSGSSSSSALSVGLDSTSALYSTYSQKTYEKHKDNLALAPKKSRTMVHLGAESAVLEREYPKKELIMDIDSVPILKDVYSMLIKEIKNIHGDNFKQTIEIDRVEGEYEPALNIYGGIYSDLIEVGATYFGTISEITQIGTESFCLHCGTSLERITGDYGESCGNCWHCEKEECSTFRNNGYEYESKMICKRCSNQLELKIEDNFPEC